jgi:hypothetical protein
MSDMHAALDSSKAESTLVPVFSFLETGQKKLRLRPNTINLLFHPYLLFLQRRMCLPPLFPRVSRLACVRWYFN